VQQFLKDALAHGPRKVSDIEEAAAKAHVDPQTLEQARADLGIVTSRSNAGGVQAVQWSLPGAERPSGVKLGVYSSPGRVRFWANRTSSRHGLRAEFDPNVWSGRALQENFHRVGGCAVLHQCIRPLTGAFYAPGHHGYQRACDLISGQASTGRRGHQCSHAPGRPILHLVSHPLADLGR
jgi:hypothetical protein